MPVLRKHHSRHFMVESADHLSTRPMLEMSNSRGSRRIERDNHVKPPKRLFKSANDCKLKISAKEFSYAITKAKKKPLEFQVGDRVMAGPVAYKLEFLEELSNVHSTFHVSNLKKCLSDESLVIPMKELWLDDKLNFVEEPIEIMDREVKQQDKSRFINKNQSITTQLHDFTTSQLQDFLITSQLHFTTLLMPQLTNATWFGFFLQMGFTLILATLDGLDVGLLGDVIGGDDCDDDE
ncbi:hypothetical protein Tco_0963012 [Tanacetum coccineum]